MQIKKELQKNKQVMQEAFRDCGDIIMREFRIRGGEGTLFLAYTDNIVNGDAIQNFIMTNVMARCEMQGTEGLLQSLMEEVIAIGELTKITTRFLMPFFWGIRCFSWMGMISPCRLRRSISPRAA